MKRFEYVWSLLVALSILGAAVAWTAGTASIAYPALASSPAKPSAVVTWRRTACQQFSQYEFKVGLLLTPGCQSQTN
jgi:hypothetical protein